MLKLLIVDDEPMIREGIRRVAGLHCPAYGTVYEAADGDEALTTAMNQMPDVIITDIQMPRLGGIEFIRQLRAENPEIVVLIISGYDDFEYAQNALKLGVKDYLLKPVDSADLAERLNAIARELGLRRVFLQDMEEMQQKVREGMALFRERFLRQLIGGSVPEERIAEQARAVECRVDGAYYGVAIVELAGRGEADSRFSETLAAAIAEQLAKRPAPGVEEVHALFSSDYELVLILGSNRSSREGSFKDFHRYLTDLGIALQKQAGMEAAISAGNVHPGPPGIHRSHQEAQEAKLYHFTAHSQPIIHYEEIAGARRIPGDQTADAMFRRLVMHVKLQEQEAALAALSEIVDYFASSPGTNPYWVKLKLMELAGALLHLLEEWGINAAVFFAGQENNPYVTIHNAKGLAELSDWMSGFLQSCQEEIAKVRMNKSAGYIEKAKAYLETAIADSQLSIADVASRLFLNPNYLRQLFRQQTGESFVEYVTRLRMERALELLKDPTLKIQDVAEKVGFEEQRYFSSCFKKFYQFTPTEYRESIR